MLGAQLTDSLRCAKCGSQACHRGSRALSAPIPSLSTDQHKKCPHTHDTVHTTQKAAARRQIQRACCQLTPKIEYPTLLAAPHAKRLQPNLPAACQCHSISPRAACCLAAHTPTHQSASCLLPLPTHTTSVPVLLAAPLLTHIAPQSPCCLHALAPTKCSPTLPLSHDRHAQQKWLVQDQQRSRLLRPSRRFSCPHTGHLAPNKRAQDTDSNQAVAVSGFVCV